MWKCKVCGGIVGGLVEAEFGGCTPFIVSLDNRKGELNETDWVSFKNGKFSVIYCCLTFDCYCQSKNLEDIAEWEDE